MKIKETGYYQTKGDHIVCIYRIEKDKAHGTISGHYDTTWWYPNNAEHAVCPIYDINAIIKVGNDPSP